MPGQEGSTRLLLPAGPRHPPRGLPSLPPSLTSQAAPGCACVHTWLFYVCVRGWGITYSLNVGQSSPCREFTVTSRCYVTAGPVVACSVRVTLPRPALEGGHPHGLTGRMTALCYICDRCSVLIWGSFWQPSSSGRHRSPCCPVPLPRRWLTCSAVTLLPVSTWNSHPESPGEPPLRRQGRCPWGPGFLTPSGHPALRVTPSPVAPRTEYCRDSF